MQQQQRRRRRPLRNTFPLVVLALLISVAPTVEARYGDCGQPATDGSIVATDATYLLNTAVGAPTAPAPLCVGDVDNSGGITATDAFIVLSEATNPGSQTLNCPSGSTCTACT